MSPHNHVPYDGVAKDHHSECSVPRRTNSKLTFSRGWLKHIANETVAIAESGTYTNHNGRPVNIRKALQYSIDNSVHYHSSHVFTLTATTNDKKDKNEQHEPQCDHDLVTRSPKSVIPPKMRTTSTTTKPSPSLFKKTEYSIIYGSSLDVAMYLQATYPDDGHVGILNSASGKSPGGKFFRGTISQEDCICRASLLYPCLKKFENVPHQYYYVNNKPKYQASSSACAIFSPKVPIIREDTVQGDLLDTYQTFSFVSIPAPNAFVLGKCQEAKSVPKAQTPGAQQRNEDYETIPLKEALHDRCFRALCMFAQNGCTDLVLCAYGCGVHGNNPTKIAKTFRNILSTPEFKGRFRTVAFAIQPSRKANYKAFVDVFPKAGRFVMDSEYR
uniref:Microbial-type PARG catalytic domain-containing protein n=1 Tax=Asterionellopsis glacialis TaxID=33640 RepID=A0A7S0KZA7_9STRA|mmetsp:Transcript_2181/g.3159  ORF Transcript_2181/g.3159 Transcript_2181/m.3159 type:complete len:386 (+) Transcript_2181:188-1345(+)